MIDRFGITIFRPIAKFSSDWLYMVTFTVYTLNRLKITLVSTVSKLNCNSQLSFSSCFRSCHRALLNFQQLPWCPFETLQIAVLLCLFNKIHGNYHLALKKVAGPFRTLIRGLIQDILNVIVFKFALENGGNMLGKNVKDEPNR